MPLDAAASHGSAQDDLSSRADARESQPRKGARWRIALAVLLIGVLLAAAGAVAWHIDAGGMRSFLTSDRNPLARVFGSESDGEHSKTPGDNPADEHFLSFGAGFTDERIDSADAARTVIASAGAALGISDAQNDLGECVESTAFENTYYRFPQYHDGIAVYGRAAVVGADSSDGALSLTSNCANVDQVATEPVISREDAQNAALEAAGDPSTAMSEGLCIYSLDGVEPTLCYAVVTESGTDRSRYFVNAADGSITAKLSLSFSDVIQAKTQEGNEIALPLENVGDDAFRIDVGLRNLELYDAQRNEIHVAYTAGADENGNTYTMSPTGEGSYAFVNSNGESLTDEDMPRGYYRLTDSKGNEIAQRAYISDADILAGSNKLEQAAGSTSWWKRDAGARTVVSAYDGINSALDFYHAVLHRDGFDGADGRVLVATNAKITAIDENGEPVDDSGNASSALLGPHLTRLCFGHKNDLATDLFAHEFTHSVERTISYMNYRGESGALMEATSDIFGELVQDFADGSLDNSCDWANTFRNAHDPQKGTKDRPNPLPTVYGGGNWQSTSAEDPDNGHVHSNSTVISHAAYTMVNGECDGEALSTDELAKLLYEAFFSLPSDCTFSQYATIVLNIANASLSPEKCDRVRCAFQQANIIPRMQSAFVKPTVYVHVYGADNEPYGNYRCNVAEEGAGGNGTPHDVTTTDPLKLTFGDGESLATTNPLGYVLAFKDKGTCEQAYFVRAIPSEDGKDTIEVYTGFSTPNQSGDGAPDAPEAPEGPDDGADSPDNAAASQDIALVLDVSGSMSGEPLEETKNAANGFIDIALEGHAGVGIVAYDSESETLSDLASASQTLKAAVNELQADSGTNMEDGLATAADLLSAGSARKKSIVLMSDGEPNEGKVGDELISYATSIKDAGVRIYALGFNESASGHELLSAIASEGCYYSVEDASSLEDFFADIASAVNGTKFMYLRVACPVDVQVTHDGETLSSVEADQNTRTSFGSLTFEDEKDEESGEINRVKVLRLREGSSYSVAIKGTGEGKMTYTIGFADDAGDYNDFRTFSAVPITSSTRIETLAETTESTKLSVDEDGDGVFEKTYRAHANEEGELVDSSWVSRSVFALSAIVAIIAVALALRRTCRKWRCQRRHDA